MDTNLNVIKFFGATAINSSDYGPAVDLGAYVRGKQCRAFLNVVSASGSLTVAIEESVSSTTGFAATEGAEAFTAATATGEECIPFIPKKRYVRAAFTVSGTGATFAATSSLAVEKLIV
jgi:hypothetical protein